MKDIVIGACRHLLAPVVRLLIRNGINWRQFSEIGKEVYVDVARQDHGRHGRPTNISRVAMITGLSRREVTRIRDVLAGRAERHPAPASRLSHVLSGWHQDKEFLDADGNPALLPRDGKRGSMEALLRRYAGDFPHSAVVKELEQLGLIEKSGAAYRALARSVIRHADDPEILRQAGIALHDHAATLNHNVDTTRSTPPRFEGMATTYRLSPKHLDAFNEFLNFRGQAFLEEADAWLAYHEEPETTAPNRRDSIRAGVGVYSIIDETRSRDARKESGK